jgi:hypothetical protein
MVAPKKQLDKMFGTARVIAFIPIWLALALSLLFTLVPDIAPEGSDFRGDLLVGVYLAYCLYLVVRSFMFRVILDENEVRITQWFRTTSVPYEEIVGVYEVGYRGLLTGISSSVFVNMVIIGIRGYEAGDGRGLVELPALMGPVWSWGRKYDRLRGELVAACGRELLDEFPG